MKKKYQHADRKNNGKCHLKAELHLVSEIPWLNSFLGILLPLKLWAAQVYYVSPQGDDSAGGTAADQAWQTVDRVNQGPGASILFEGSQTFHEYQIGETCES